MATTQRIIAFTGARGAGKTTAAEAAASKYARDTRNVARIASFALPLKRLCADMFPGNDAAFFGTQDEKNQPRASLNGWSGRRILQHVGTEGFRTIDPDFWAKRCVNELQICKDLGLILIDDLRYMNEAHALRALPNVEIYTVLRPSLELDDTHASEQDWPDIVTDGCIRNVGTLAEFEADVCKVLGL